MKITGRALYKTAIYIFIFFLLFIALTFAFFPYGKLKKPIELSVYDNTGLKASIQSIGHSFLFGLNLSGVKISGYSGGADNRLRTLAHIKNVSVNNIALLAADYIFFKGIPVNLRLEGVKIHSVKKGFINIPELNLKTLNAELYINKSPAIAGKGTGKWAAVGKLLFSGDLTGSLKIKTAELKPLLIINKGVFKVKPVKTVYGKFSRLFTTMFRKGKSGYFIYSINNLIL